MEDICDLQLAGLRMIQSDAVFRFGTDAVLLAAFCDVGARDRVADLGTGSGILPLLLYGRTQARIVGLELQEQAVDLARRNVALNHVGDRIDIVQGDLREARALLKGRFTAVVTNPPYHREGSGAAPEGAAHRLARQEGTCTLKDVIAGAASLLQTGGRLFLVYRAARLAELLQLCRQHRLEPKVLRLVAPRAGAEPATVLLKAVLGAATGLRVRPTLVLQDENGPTPEVRQIYSGGRLT